MPLNALSAVIQASIQSTARRNVGIDNPIDQLQETWRYNVALGTAAAQADIVFHVHQTIGGGAQTYDLAGTLTNVFGETIVFAGVNAIFVKNLGANNLVMGGIANACPLFFNAAANSLSIAAGQFFMAVNQNLTDWPVTPGTADLLGFVGTNGDIFDLVLLGRSA